MTINNLLNASHVLHIGPIAKKARLNPKDIKDRLTKSQNGLLYKELTDAEAASIRLVMCLPLQAIGYQRRGTYA